MSGLYCNDCGYLRVTGQCECPPAVECDCEPCPGCWPRPIPVTERMADPNDDGRAMVFGTIGEGVVKTSPAWWMAYVICSDGAYHFRDCVFRLPVDGTHWLPLPPDPKEQP